MTVRRVVVAIAGGDRTFRVVREAVRVASCLDAALEGRFLEDEDLLRLAAYSFAQRTDSAGGTRALRAEDLEREWRAVAADVRSTLEREAAHQRVEARFAVERGRPRDAVSRQIEQGDVVVVGWGGWSPKAARSAPVRVLFDGSDAAERALEAGARLAGDDGRLSVWVVGGDDAAVEATRERLSGRVARLRVAPIADATPPTVQHILAAHPGGLLLVPSTSGLAEALASGADDARFPAGVLVVH
ncbi:MAG: hypothetical protein H6719_16715 [Sandaracinaceae bacterium]|nr:hypothetical protein [Sandaracinaceae bacterium]